MDMKKREEGIRKKKNRCVCVCVCVREREKESVCGRRKKANRSIS